jgi:hypothetical protein
MQTLECPHCRKEVAIPSGKWLTWWRTKKPVFWLGAGSLTLLILALLAYRYRGHILSGLDLIAEGTGSRTTALWSLLGVMLVLVVLFAWMLFPIIVFLGFWELRRRTAELDRTTRLCASQLAELAAEHDPDHKRIASPSSPEVAGAQSRGEKPDADTR